MTRVLISDEMSPLAEECLTQSGIEVDVITDLNERALGEIIHKYDGLVIRSSTKVTSKIIEFGTNLKVIGRAGIGVDNIDIEKATASGIAILNTPFGNSITTAEHTISMMLSIARRIPQANALTHQGKWEKSRFMGVELMGKTLGIIGCGNIGSVVADRAQGLKMKVIAYDPFLTIEKAEDLGVEKVELNHLLKRSDFISLHTPLTDATRNILNKRTFAKMKKGVHIINCARGGLVVEEDLKIALDQGDVAGAALDVFASEPAEESSLIGMENIIATPHLGAATIEAQQKVAQQVAEQVANFLNTGAVTNALNMASVSAEEAVRLKPYLLLAKQLGSFAGQATNSAIKEVTVAFDGLCGDLNYRPLTAIVLQWLLLPQMEGVNMVNAPTIAKDRDIHIKEIRSNDAGTFQTLMTLTVKSETQTRSISGSLFNDMPRLVRIKGIAIDAKLGLNMLYITNKDKPGLIGKLGTLLGNAGINIATFHLGRSNQGGDAIALIETDGEIPSKLLQKILSLEHVVTAVPMKF
ncbi:MAG: phosphoglycerate dehydrogenase [Pseudomonadota bacterium]|nr:phosphoglycerate dehydrogenase [Pseudomonadota bacterium]